MTNWITINQQKIEQQLHELLNINGSCQTLLESMHYSSLLGGKRIRPLFTLASGKLSNANTETLLIIGGAIELIHCFSLIHDDLPIMDNDDLRRGKPTNHKVYGDAIALLAGDALHTYAFEILSNETLQINTKHKIKIIHNIACAIGVNGMVGGQAIDWLSTGKILSLEQLKHMHSLKTGKLISSSIICGYLAGENINENTLKMLTNIAEKIGLLFQIVDDIIDVTQSSETLGKTANKDLDNNKATYVNLLGLNKAKQSAQNLYQEITDELKLHVNTLELQQLTNIVYYRNN